MMKFPGQLVFGLDIGTRSIVGTVGYRTGERFHVISQCIREHEKIGRASCRERV